MKYINQFEKKILFSCQKVANIVTAVLDGVKSIKEEAEL
jgi:hypothetical protein